MFTQVEMEKGATRFLFIFRLNMKGFVIFFRLVSPFETRSIQKCVVLKRNGSIFVKISEDRGEVVVGAACSAGWRHCG